MEYSLGLSPLCVSAVSRGLSPSWLTESACTHSPEEIIVVPDRYVQLPNGSYLQWPEGVSAATFKAKATKLMGENRTSSPNVATGSISAEKPATGFAKTEQWSQQLINDLQHGTDITGVGA